MRAAQPTLTVREGRAEPAKVGREAGFAGAARMERPRHARLGRTRLTRLNDDARAEWHRPTAGNGVGSDGQRMRYRDEALRDEPTIERRRGRQDVVGGESH